jgi:hypothetical protein
MCSVRDHLVRVNKMKKVVLSVLFIFAASVFSSVLGQAAPPGAGTPAGAGDKNLGDDGIKARSVEMERMKQDAQKVEAAAFAPVNKDIVARFPQIKEDFEGIQIFQATIITAYTTGKTIDYLLIGVSADGINKKAKRLDANLFAANSDKKADKAADNNEPQKLEKTRTIRELIVDLDKTIGSFVSSPIFGNIKVIEPEVAMKTREDLINIMQLSEKLSAEAKKQKYAVFCSGICDRTVMRKAAFVVFGLLLVPVSLYAQVSPNPVADMEVRDSNSIRMRSLEIERVKRDANKPHLTETSQEAETRIARISNDFEKIQRLQSSIVKAYTTGKTINYKQIRESAVEMRKRAVRLGINFFSTNAETVNDETRRERPPAIEDVKDMVVELDEAIGAFVTSPVFERAVVDSRLLEKAQLDLVKIVILSDRLSHIADGAK